eukprot:UN02267
MFVLVWTTVGTWVAMLIVNRFGKPLTEEEYLLGLDITEQGVRGYDQLQKEEMLSKFIEYASKGYLKGCSLILKSGFDCNEGDYDGRRALHLAASEGNAEVVKYLIEEKADVNVQDRWGGTPLQDASHHGHTEVVDLLKANGGTMENRNYATQLCDFAASGNLAEIKRYMKDLNADVGAVDYDGRSALHLAAAEGQVEVVQFIISQGVKS